MENQRIRLSKAMLKNALMRLLKEKPIEKISVYELCAAAQINRTTFYRYYDSQYELLSDAENDYFRKLEDVLSENAADGGDSLYRVLEALLADKEAFMTLAESLPDRDFSDKLFNLPSIRMQFDRAIPDTFSDREREHLRVFFYQGGYALIREWLGSGDSRESPGVMAGFLYGIIRKLMQ